MLSTSLSEIGSLVPRRRSSSSRPSVIGTAEPIGIYVDAVPVVEGSAVVELLAERRGLTPQILVAERAEPVLKAADQLNGRLHLADQSIRARAEHAGKDRIETHHRTYPSIPAL